MGNGKNRAHDSFLNWGAPAEKCESLFQNIDVFCILSCQNIVNTSGFGWFALGAGRLTSEANTSIYDTFQAPWQKNQAKYTVFSAFTKKNTANSGVFGRVLSLMLQKYREKTTLFFNNTEFLDGFGLKHWPGTTTTTTTTCAYASVRCLCFWPLRGRTLPRSGVKRWIDR